MHIAYKNVVRTLVAENAVLGRHVFLHGAVVVQMFLVYIDQHADVGRYRHVFQLVAGQFKDDPGVRADLLQVVEGRNSDISHHHAVLPRAF